MATSRQAAGSRGEWISDHAVKLEAPHPTGGYDSVEHDRLYRLGGLLHRLDGPAASWADGTRLHYAHGRLHRAGGEPAVYGGKGAPEWWVDGVRQDTPADADVTVPAVALVPSVAAPAKRRKRATV
ncbi:MAG: hypothetical protein ACXIUP_00270 [Microcella sp.]